MPVEHKPHSELVARVRSALGASGQQEQRGRAALDELEEQLEAMERERAEYRDVLERIVRRHTYREVEELPTLAFTMKEDALEVLASYPASEPEA